jgi:hypothetical protein
MDEQNHLVQVAILQTRVQNLTDNIARQALEYERRLTDLNHAHAQATVDRNKYVSADLFYSKLDEIAKWRGEFDQWRSRAIGIAIGAGLAAGVTGGTVAGLLAKTLK